MDKQLALGLAHDVETSMKILAIAVKQENANLAVEALANAENELATIRRLFKQSSSPPNTNSQLDSSQLGSDDAATTTHPM